MVIKPPSGFAPSTCQEVSKARTRETRRSQGRGYPGSAKGLAIDLLCSKLKLFVIQCLPLKIGVYLIQFPQRLVAAVGLT